MLMYNMTLPLPH